MKKKLGKLDLIRNKRRKPAANRYYLRCKVIVGNRAQRIAHFTEHQLEVAFERARKNKEDSR